eukprot:s2926_g3.t1
MLKLWRVMWNLYSLQLCCAVLRKDRTGSYTFLSSMIYGCCGLFLIILRILPRHLVTPRKVAWEVLVRYTFTRGCPEWYRPFASATIAKWLDSSFTVIYVTVAARLIFRAMPWVVERTSSRGTGAKTEEGLAFILPFSPGRSIPHSSQMRILIYEKLVASTRKLMFGCLFALSARMLLNLKDGVIDNLLCLILNLG